jgi:hypothetical protein
VLENLDGDDEVEPGVAERKPLQVCTEELGLEADLGSRPPGSVQDAVGDVDSYDPLRRAESRQRREIAAVAAPRVQVGRYREQVPDLLREDRELAVERRVGDDRHRVLRPAPLLVDLPEVIRGRDLGHGCTGSGGGYE